MKCGICVELVHTSFVLSLTHSHLPSPSLPLRDQTHHVIPFIGKVESGCAEPPSMEYVLIADNQHLESK